MRDILFRGKRIDHGKWVYGFYAGGFTDGNHEICNINSPTLACVEVYGDTVGQYTGLKDENGKRIFEGDIVQYHERQFDGKDVPVRDAVVYEEGGFAVRAYFLNNWLWNYINGNTQLRDVEIIGNIHDNPELLKEGDG